jgi:hypothetical protein
MEATSLWSAGAFVVSHATTAALRSMSEARINGAPGSSSDELEAESDRIK